VLASTGLLLLNRELPRLIERELNAKVMGYQFTMGQASLSPALSLEVQQLTMSQTEHPFPPVAEIPRWRLSIQWRPLLSGALVGDSYMSRPTLHITLPQAKQEVQDDVPIHQKGWQDAVYAFYPLDMNKFVIEDADVTYVDQDASKPLHFTHVNVHVENIRNIRSSTDTYPSDLTMDGTIFGSGRIQIKGHANFLAQPHAGINTDVVLEQVALEPLLPVTGRYNVQVRDGILSAIGHLEYTADDQTMANLKKLTIENIRIDYVHTSTSTHKEAQVGHATAKTAKEVSNKPDTVIRIDQAEITNSEFGFVNEAANPRYRVFLRHAALRLHNVSNHFSEGTGLVTLTGEFMGTGNTVISGTFRPEKKSPDFDLDVKIERTQMRPMNELLRAYGNFDVTAGLFSVYSELHVKDRRVDGYIKPLFKEMKVFDARQDQEKNLFHQLYEGLVGGVAALLENRPRKEVATQTEISGPLESPKTSTWQTLINLIRNAFFKAVLPGFEKEVRSHA
jgi:hypothetical protein